MHARMKWEVVRIVARLLPGHTPQSSSPKQATSLSVHSNQSIKLSQSNTNKHNKNAQAVIELFRAPQARVLFSTTKQTSPTPARIHHKYKIVSTAHNLSWMYLHRPTSSNEFDSETKRSRLLPLSQANPKPQRIRTASIAARGSGAEQPQHSGKYC
jgi:hypothetical protein